MGRRELRWGFMMSSLLTVALWTTACGNNTPAANTAAPASTPTVVPGTFSLKNSSSYAITQLSAIGYPSGTVFAFPLTVSSGASTVLDFQIQNGFYFVDVYDNGGQYDGWGPLSLNLGTNYPVTITNATGTLSSTTCTSCGI